MIRQLALALALLPFAATAADTDGPALGAAEFGAIVTGHTFTWLADGEPYGVERYAEGQRVIWAFLGDRCQEGKWYQRADLICFHYPAQDVEQCWRFSKAPDGALMARFAGDPASPLYTVEQSALICPDYSS